MKFTIPANAPAKPFHKHWQFCVGSGHAAMAMRTDYCEQLKQIHDELGIERVRFHGIFSDDMHTYDTMSTVMPMPGSEQVPFYENSFRLPGLVYDNVLKAGMKPFVELSFMPSPMAKRPTRGTFYWKPCIAPPKDEAQWQAYIQKFVRFLLNRYGKEEVETWFFEVWNEPDLKTPFFDGTQEDYFRLYEITAKAVKAVDDKLKVGGPATSNSKWVAAFVDYCKAHDAPVDFITTHQYAGDPISEVCDQKDADHMKDTAEIQAEYKVDFAQLFAGLKPEDGLLPMFRRTMPDNTETDDLNRDLLRDAAEQVQKQADGLPVYYTEWNGCATFGAPGNDTRKVAAYDVRAALSAEDFIDGSSIWCFSDIFEEIHPFPEEFHGGYGLVTQHAGAHSRLFRCRLRRGCDQKLYPCRDGVDPLAGCTAALPAGAAGVSAASPCPQCRSAGPCVPLPVFWRGSHLCTDVGHDFPAVLHNGRHRRGAAFECRLDDLCAGAGCYRVSSARLA